MLEHKKYLCINLSSITRVKISFFDDGKSMTVHKRVKVDDMEGESGTKWVIGKSRGHDKIDFVVTYCLSHAFGREPTTHTKTRCPWTCKRHDMPFIYYIYENVLSH